MKQVQASAVALRLVTLVTLFGAPPVLAQMPVVDPDRGSVLEKIAPHISVVYLDDGQGGKVKTIRFTGVNVQVVNGLGVTNGNPADPDPRSGAPITNGLGNLIVGYNEPNPASKSNRLGSHNFVGGAENDFNSFGGLVVGFRNSISGRLTSVSAGAYNTATGYMTSVSGGTRNMASGGLYDGFAGLIAGGSVSGGRDNTACGYHSSVSGGRFNTASGYYSSILGGSSSIASGRDSSVSGGNANSASGMHSSVSGGGFNSAQGSTSSVSGGFENTAYGTYSSVSGGVLNTASGRTSSVSGGNRRSVSGRDDWRAGTLFEDD